MVTNGHDFMKDSAAPVLEQQHVHGKEELVQERKGLTANVQLASGKLYQKAKRKQ